MAKMKLLLVIATILPAVLYGQTATFYADTTRFREFAKANKQVMEMEWRLHGTVFHFGSKPINVKTHPTKMDTLFFKQSKNAKWDTLICFIREPLTYKFVYNPCCGGFNVEGPNGHFIEGRVNFRLDGKQGKRPLLFTLDGSGILVKDNSMESLQDHCRSAMFPNIYTIKLSEIETCTASPTCEEYACLAENKAEGTDFYYRVVSSKLKVQVMPLSNDPILVTYNTRSGKVTIK